VKWSRIAFHCAYCVVAGREPGIQYSMLRSSGFASGALRRPGMTSMDDNRHRAETAVVHKKPVPREGCAQIEIEAIHRR
jgi:hypothetical protein